MAKFKRISFPRIKKAAQKVASAINPEKIILFGSYAYGQPTPDSDVDFLLVVRNRSRKERHKIFLKASDALYPRPFSVDLVVRSQKDIQWRIRGGDFFLQDVMKKGRVLYER